MVADPMQAAQPNEANRSPEIQTGVNGAAPEDLNWYPLLEKTRQAALQSIEEYLASQGLVPTGEADPLVMDLSMAWRVNTRPVTTEQDVRKDLQALQDLFPHMRASAIIMSLFALICFFLVTIIMLPIWFLTPLHESESSLGFLCWFPSQFLAGEAIFQLMLWYLVGRCIANTASVGLKLDEGQLRSSDKVLLRGWVWRLPGFIHKVKLEGDGPTSAQSNV